ncbi:MAG: hypothetical protein LPK02_06910, partial [Rhodobacterales bacterium]|nr:hypothetical protein [Rhodobacterales bacterium]
MPTVLLNSTPVTLNGSPVSLNGVTTGGGGIPARVALDGTYYILIDDAINSASTLTWEIRGVWDRVAAGRALHLFASNSTGASFNTANELAVFTGDLGGGTFVTGFGYAASTGVQTIRYEIDPAGGLAGGNTLRVTVDGALVLSSSAAGTSVDTSLLSFFVDNALNLSTAFIGEVERLTVWRNGTQILNVEGDASVWNSLPGATGTVTNVPGTGGGAGPTPVSTVRQYYYLNSLVSHETGAWTTSTQLPNWMGRFAAAAGTTYAVDSEFGFAPAWTLPPRANMGFADAAAAGVGANSWTGAQNIDRLSFVPDNFDGQSFDPNANTNILTSTSYQTRLLELIDGWEANAPNANRVYTVYAGWPDMGPYGDPATISAGQLAAWQAYGLGAYNDWMELLVSRLQTARPGLDIRLSNVNRVLMLTYQNTVVSTIPAGTLFEDDAPHGRSGWYFLAALAEYMHSFQQKPPAGYTPLAGYNVPAEITSNYQTIVDYMWSLMDFVEATPAAPVNTTAPTISGATAVGSVLTATTGVWTGVPTPTYTYQWLADATPIGGATASTYTTIAGNVGQSITCEVTATNASGSASQVSSNAIIVSAGGSGSVSRVASTTGAPTVIPDVTFNGVTGEALVFNGNGSFTLAEACTVYPLLQGAGGAGGKQAFGGADGGNAGQFLDPIVNAFAATAATYNAVIGIGGLGSESTGTGASGSATTLTGPGVSLSATGGTGGIERENGLGGSGSGGAGTGRNGGPGTSSSITGTPTFYGGGGGGSNPFWEAAPGGLGGSGGGGNGGDSPGTNSGGNGVDGLGGGGGAAG